MKKTLVAFLAAAMLEFGGPRLLRCDDSAGIARDEMVVVSSAVSPRVAYALSRQEGVLAVTISVASFGTPPEGETIGLQLGLAADKVVRLSEKQARSKRAGQALTYEFRVPEERLVASQQGWDKLRMGIAVSWPGGPLGQPRQREAFLQNNARATHAGLSPSPDDWQLVSLAEYQRAVADRRLQIAVDFVQPMEGKASIVIDDDQGPPRAEPRLRPGLRRGAAPHRLGRRK